MTPPRAVRHLTVKDLADRWHTTPWGIYAAKKRGHVPPCFRRTPRGPLLFPEKGVEAYEREHLITT